MLKDLYHGKIHETQDPTIMLNLGGHYYDQKNYDIALKYYMMASEREYEKSQHRLSANQHRNL